MPFYEYECNLCHNRFEVRQGYLEESLSHCPKCNGEVRRLFLPVPVIFKGSGFYITDNRKDNGNEKKEVTPSPAVKGDKNEAKSSVSPAKDDKKQNKD